MHYTIEYSSSATDEVKYSVILVRFPICNRFYSLLYFNAWSTIPQWIVTNNHPNPPARCNNSISWGPDRHSWRATTGWPHKPSAPTSLPSRLVLITALRRASGYKTLQRGTILYPRYAVQSDCFFAFLYIQLCLYWAMPYKWLKVTYCLEFLSRVQRVYELSLIP